MDEESIFSEAVKMKSFADRSAYLDRVCGNDTELRASLDTLLRADQLPNSPLDEPPAAFMPIIAAGEFDIAADDPDALSFLAGSEKAGCLGKLRQYEAIDVVGHGGMGIVLLRAYDTTLNRV